MVLTRQEWSGSELRGGVPACGEGPGVAPGAGVGGGGRME